MELAAPVVYWCCPLVVYGSLRAVDRRCCAALPAMHPGFGLMCKMLRLVSRALCALIRHATMRPRPSPCDESSLRMPLRILEMLVFAHGSSSDLVRLLVMYSDIIQGVARRSQTCAVRFQACQLVHRLCCADHGVARIVAEETHTLARLMALRFYCTFQLDRLEAITGLSTGLLICWMRFFMVGLNSYRAVWSVLYFCLL